VKYLIEECKCEPDIKQRAKRSFGGRTPLHWAARAGHLDVVKFLLTSPSCQSRVDVNAVTNDGTTALCWAAWQCHLGVMKMLASHGASVNATNIYGCNAALWCAQSTSAAIADRLPTDSSCTSSVDEPDSTQIGIFKWLPSMGCSLGIVNTNGHGVLHKAAQRGRRDVCAWFLDQLAITADQEDRKDSSKYLAVWSLVSPDTDGNTPSDLAGVEGAHNQELAEWLAAQEIRIARTLIRVQQDELPTWFTAQAPSKCSSEASLVAAAVWAPWEGVRRMVAAAACSF
jgi:ankyrin repeat protein